jgi:hypothetical protein
MTASADAAALGVAIARSSLIGPATAAPYIAGGAASDGSVKAFPDRIYERQRLERG